MNKKVISFSVYINLGELQNCPAFLMHKQDNSSLSPRPQQKGRKENGKTDTPYGMELLEYFRRKDQ